jgi:hypothetical protein
VREALFEQFPSVYQTSEYRHLLHDAVGMQSIHALNRKGTRKCLPATSHSIRRLHIDPWRKALEKLRKAVPIDPNGTALMVCPEIGDSHQSEHQTATFRGIISSG